MVPSNAAGVDSLSSNPTRGERFFTSQKNQLLGARSVGRLNSTPDDRGRNDRTFLPIKNARRGTYVVGRGAGGGGESAM